MVLEGDLTYPLHKASSNHDAVRVTRRRLGKATMWTLPTIVAAGAVPAYAATPDSPTFGFQFDGGTFANGIPKLVFLNFGVAPGAAAPYTSASTITVTFDVVGLNMTDGAPERSMTITSSHGDITRGSYDSATRTTTFTWAIPAGTNFPTVSTSLGVPDVSLAFGDGFSFRGRVTNKIVVTSVSGAIVSSPGPLPLDSTIVKDLSGPSGDGIY